MKLNSDTLLCRTGSRQLLVNAEGPERVIKLVGLGSPNLQSRGPTKSSEILQLFSRPSEWSERGKRKSIFTAKTRRISNLETGECIQNWYWWGWLQGLWYWSYWLSFWNKVTKFSVLSTLYSTPSLAVKLLKWGWFKHDASSSVLLGIYWASRLCAWNLENCLRGFLVVLRRQCSGLYA